MTEFHPPEELVVLVVGCVLVLLAMLVAVALFALVIATYVGIVISWIAGMIYCLKGQVRPMPLFGIRLARQRTPQTTPTPETTAELIERTSTSDA